MNIYYQDKIYINVDPAFHKDFAGWVNFTVLDYLLCHPPNPFKDGQEVVEGVDYEKKYQTLLFNDWFECTKYEYDNSVDYLRRIIALPIEGKEDASSSSTDKELTPMAQVLKMIKDNVPADTIGAYIESTLLEAERKMAALIYKDGCIEGLSAFDNPLKFFDDYFNSKYKQ